MSIGKKVTEQKKQKSSQQIKIFEVQFFWSAITMPYCETRQGKSIGLWRLD